MHARHAASAEIARIAVFAHPDAPQLAAPQKGDDVKSTTSFWLLLLCATALVAANLQPLNVKTGLWQVTAVSKVNGPPTIPPEMQAQLAQLPPDRRAQVEAALKSRFSGTPTNHSYKTCVTQKTLNGNPWANGPNEKCTWNVVSSTSSDMEVKGTLCAAGRNQGRDTNVDIKVHAVNSENVKATVSGTSTGNGQTITFNNDLTGKWLGANCPAGMD